MANMLISFQYQYWEYGDNVPVHKRDLTIKGYKSSWLTDLCASFVLEMIEKNLKVLDDFYFLVSIVMMVLECIIRQLHVFK